MLYLKLFIKRLVRFRCKVFQETANPLFELPTTFALQIADEELRAVGLNDRGTEVENRTIDLIGVNTIERTVVFIASAEGCPEGVHPQAGAS